MRFLLIIFDDQEAWATVDTGEMEKVMRQHERVTADLKSQGKWVGCERLHPSAEASTVRMRDGHHVVGQGPYGKTKEVIGGYYLITCESSAEAVDWAKRLPLAGRSIVEIRQLWDE